MLSPAKKLCVLLFFVLVVFLPGKCQQRITRTIHYLDTTANYGDLRFDFRFSRARLFWFKTTVYISNPTKHYWVFEVDDIFASAPRSRKFRVHRRRRLVAGPEQQTRYALRFDGLKLYHDSVYFHIQKAKTTDGILLAYAPFRVEIKPKNRIQLGSLELEILGMSQSKNYYKVKVRIQHHSKDKFLSTVFENVAIQTQSGHTIQHKTKKHPRNWLTRTNQWEVVTFVFPAGPDVKNDGYLYFKDVFSEHALLNLQSFDLTALFKNCLQRLPNK